MPVMGTGPGRMVLLVCLVLLLPPVFSHAAITIDGTIGPGPAGKSIPGPNYAITSDLGQIRGNNLFHSFGTFNVQTNENAIFSGPTGIQNIIGRVTGGELSSIDGGIVSEISGANLFLLNPSGILFGPHSHLDVKGSFHASTADSLRFSNGEVFNVDPARNSTLSVASPESFGFLKSNPAGISIADGSDLSVPKGAALSLIAGNIEVGKATLKAESGRINLAAVGSPGEVTPVYGQNPDLRLDNFTRLGDISLSLTTVSTKGDPGGSIYIRGGSLTISSRSDWWATINSGTTGALDGAAVGVDIGLTGKFSMPGGEIASSSSGSGRSGDIRIFSDTLELGGVIAYTDIACRALASGQGGDIELDAQHILLKNTAYVESWVRDNGKGGSINITSNDLQIDKANIWAGTSGSGPGGSITINSNDILISGIPTNGTHSCIGLYTEAGGQAGDLRLTADNLTLRDGGFIYNGTWATGNAGNIDIKANVSIQNGAQIYDISRSKGNAGKIDISSDTLSILGSPDNDTGIYANAFSSGKGGDLLLTSKNIDLTNYGSIAANTFGTGSAGNIKIQTDTLQIRNGSYVTATGNYGAGTGDSGSVEIAAKSILISGFEHPGDSNTSIFVGPGDGKGGDLLITADTLTLDNRAQINSSSFGIGNAGDIVLNIGKIELLNGGEIFASAFGSGRGGTIRVNADDILISGVHPDPYTFNGITTLCVSAIGSQGGYNGGDAGDVIINTRNLSLLDGGQISAGTFGTGKGGSINISSDALLISGTNAVHRDYLINSGLDRNRATIAASSGILASSSNQYVTDNKTGDAGNIRISSPSIMLEQNGRISSTTSGTGNGGHIQIEAKGLDLNSGAAVSSSSNGQGKGGRIEIAADRFNSSGGTVSSTAKTSEGGSIDIRSNKIGLAGGSLVSTSSSGAGNAGNISIGAADSLALSGGSTISSEARLADGGTVVINAGSASISDGSKISTSVTGGSGNGGSISLTTSSLDIADGSIESSTAGSGTGGSIDIASSGMRLSPGGLISAQSSGKGNAGNISISVADTFLIRGGKVTTAAAQADGGNIFINAGYMLRMVDGEISASVGGGPQTTGGNITIDPQYVILDGSRIIANAFEGKGGNIQITAGLFLADPASVVDASSALGIDGSVDIRAAISDVSGILTPLPKEFLDATTFLREACETRVRAGKQSSLVVRGRDGIPFEPGGFMSSYQH